MKIKPCPICGNPPDRMKVNSLKVITCLKCSNDLDMAMGQPSVALWNQQHDGVKGAIKSEAAQQRER